MDKNEVTERMWPGVTFDTALPQPWVNAIMAEDAYWVGCDHGKFDPRGQIVWGYPKGSLFGLPLPLTIEAMCFLYSNANNIPKT